MLPILRVNADVRHVGERADLDFTDPVVFSGIPVTLDAYTTVDAGATFGALQLRGAEAEIGVRVRNVFDASYAEIYNFPTEGRVLQLTARLTLSR